MINAASVGQALGDISKKFQKLEGFTRMNASQLLEVHKGFCQSTSEARQEANRKMKSKVDLLAAALAG
jgi:hypothetical protein